MFDIYLPNVVLAPALIYFVAPEMGTVEKSVVSGSIFAATLLGRPIGSVIFDHFADSIGRRRTTIISVVLLAALEPRFRVGWFFASFRPESLPLKNKIGAPT